MQGLLHVCEVCRTEVVLTPEEAYESGWDYPPRMGEFGVIGARTCPNCPINRTVWWAIAVDGYTEDMLSQQQLATIKRILGEPESITAPRARE
ncbi:hypothetical protein MAHJHV63_43810 [Mycobacterium avium subsp. hominissuis]|jgi:hypothetical protein